MNEFIIPIISFTLGFFIGMGIAPSKYYKHKIVTVHKDCLQLLYKDSHIDSKTGIRKKFCNAMD
jgi:hypothetical protein